MRRPADPYLKPHHSGPGHGGRSAAARAVAAGLRPFRQTARAGHAAATFSWRGPPTRRRVRPTILRCKGPGHCIVQQRARNAFMGGMAQALDIVPSNKRRSQPVAPDPCNGAGFVAFPAGTLARSRPKGLGDGRRGPPDPSNTSRHALHRRPALAAKWSKHLEGLAPYCILIAFL